MPLVTGEAPAYVRVLVLSVGLIESSRFFDFFHRLQNEASEISLGDVVPYATGDEDRLFRPRAFRDGHLLFNYTPYLPTEQEQQLSPFDLFREPLLVLGVVDGMQEDGDRYMKDIHAAAEYLRERHPRVVHRQLLVLDGPEDETSEIRDGVTRVEHAGENGHKSLNMALSQLSARFLVELSTYARAMQASPAIQTPGQTAKSLQRAASTRDADVSATADAFSSAQNTAPSTPTSEELPKLRPLSSAGHPPTTASAPGSEAVASPPRPNSQSGNRATRATRASSADRVSLQAFGSAASQEKLKFRNKARVGIVFGTIYMMAGQWKEALRILDENTTKLRAVSDNIWYGKGLENITVCLLLIASKTALDFEIPVVCYISSEKRFQSSVPSSSTTARSSRQALVNSLPEMIKRIIDLYHSNEGSQELPPFAVSSATIRLSSNLGRLQPENVDNLRGIVAHKDAFEHSEGNLREHLDVNNSKPSVVEILIHAYPHDDDRFSVGTEVDMLAAIAQVYGQLGMHRKKALTLKGVIVKLTHALLQARKRGAAEMGIHPAASLSIDAATDSVTGFAEENAGMRQMIAHVAQVYGVRIENLSGEAIQKMEPDFFGSVLLKTGILRDALAFCETAPDPVGVMYLANCALKLAGPGSAVDATSGIAATTLSREEQSRLVATINRANGMSKHLESSGLHAVFWDPFIVRSVEFSAAASDRAILDYSKLDPNVATRDSASSVAHVPHYSSASRPGATLLPKSSRVLVQYERTECIVSLQNPYDIPIKLDSLKLESNGAELESSHESISLGPTRIQQVVLSVLPRSTGEIKLTGCHIRVNGCAERLFPIVENPWTPSPATVVKEIGQHSQPTSHKTFMSGLPLPQPQFVTALATVVPAQPVLQLESTSLVGNSVMLLDGESLDFEAVLYNPSDVEARVFSIVTNERTLALKATVDDVLERESSVFVQPGARFSYRFILTGQTLSSHAQATFYYGTGSRASKYARSLCVPLEVTVRAALKAQNLDLIPTGDSYRGGSHGSLLLSLDVSNVWNQPISYDCIVDTTSEEREDSSLTWSSDTGLLAPGEVRRLQIPVHSDLLDTHLHHDVAAAQSAILRKLNISWTADRRKGRVDASGLTLNPSALDLLRSMSARLKIRIFENGIPVTGPVKLGAFISIRVSVATSAMGHGPLFVRIQPIYSNALERVHDERHVAAAGALEAIVPQTLRVTEAAVDFTLCPLVIGALKISAAVRRAQMGNVASTREWLGQSSMIVDVE